jgi:hypothetical protein
MRGQEADILQKTGEFGCRKLSIEDTLIEAIVSFEGPEVILNVLSQILIDKHRVILPAKGGGPAPASGAGFNPLRKSTVRISFS